VPYTITTDEYSHDAYAGKVKRFSPMMRSRGFEVYHYGIETSDSGATKDIDLMTKDEWTKLRIETFQFLEPGLSLEDATKKHYDPKQPIGVLWHLSSPLIVEFNRRLKIKLNENYRNGRTDIVCLPQGITHDPAIRDMKYNLIETGIGYSTLNSHTDFKIFESYSWMSSLLGSTNKSPSNYWFVIPNYFDSSEFKLTLNPCLNKVKRVAFLGRLGTGKGCNIVVEVARRFPDVLFTLCGSGDASPFLKEKNIEYREPIHGAERSEYLGDCIAVLCPSKFLEPFCGVAVEAQICGTPAITSDWGGMAETVEQFKTGLRCHTLADYCLGVQMALDGKFDRAYIRERAVRMFDMYNLAYNYEQVFRTVLDVFTPGKNGWYSPDSNIKDKDATPLIPKKIWQTWKTKDMPPKMKECVDSLKQQHPDFEHTLFDDNDCREFIETNFPKEVLIAYDSLIPGAYKADLWRLCVLYIHGGIYMDIKLKLCNGMNLNLFLDNEYFANGSYVENGVNRIGIYNAFIISKKANPILLNCIEHIVSNVATKFYGKTSCCVTGPLLLGKIVEASKARPNLDLKHYGPKSNETIRMSNTIICEHYKEYRAEQSGLNTKYYEQAWNEKDIYNENQLVLSDILSKNTWSSEFVELINSVESVKIETFDKESETTQKAESNITSMEQVFTNIYENRSWGGNVSNEFSGTSGSGSSVEYNNKVYIPFLKKYITDNNIKTVVDLGCGDFRCGSVIYDSLDIIYNGYHAYNKVIEVHKKNHVSAKYNFTHLDFFNQCGGIVAGDLCILKDVLQHWSLANIYTFMDYLVASKKFKHILLINCSYQDKDDTDIPDGGIRPLSCEFLPLKKYKPIKLCNYNTKEISVITIRDEMQVIPKKIWQTWHSKDISPTIKKCVDMLIKNNPEFDHELFNGDMCREFIEKHFPIEVSLAYNSLVPPAFKADLWRLCILYIHGGIYLDIKFTPCNGYSFKELLDKEYFVKGGLSEDKKRWIDICNGFMVCNKGNKILLKCILHIVLNVSKKMYGYCNSSITGPELIGRIVKLSRDLPDLPDITLQYRYYNDCEYFYKSTESIGKYEDVILEGSKEYRAEQLASGVKHYSELWKLREVYSKKDQEALKKIYDDKSWSNGFNELLKLVDCSRLDDIMKYSGHTF